MLKVPKFLEKKLKKEYGADSKVPYAIMNKMGAMHGNKETAKGRNMEKKHADKMHVTAPIRGLSSRDVEHKKKKKKHENDYDPLARAMNK